MKFNTMIEKEPAKESPIKRMENNWTTVKGKVMQIVRDNQTRDKIKTVLRTYVETTSLKGVPKIFKSKSIPLRILWGIAFLFGFAVALLFLINLFTNFMSNQVTTNMKLCNDCKAPFPDLTVCNLNPLGSIQGLEGLQTFSSYVDQLSSFVNDTYHNEALRSAIFEQTDIVDMDEFNRIYESMLSLSGYYQNINDTVLLSLTRDIIRNFVHDCQW